MLKLSVAVTARSVSGRRDLIQPGIMEIGYRIGFTATDLKLTHLQESSVINTEINSITYNLFLSVALSLSLYFVKNIMLIKYVSLTEGEFPPT